MANPPIVIGTFDNVPAPGSPIRSDWPQEISTLVTAHTVDIAAAMVHSTLFGVDKIGLLRLAGGNSVQTSNANGELSIVFAHPFAFAPLCFAMTANPVQSTLYTPVLIEPTLFWVRATNTATGAPLANTPGLAFNWLAIGTR
jgi:hypothetical protein